MRGSFAAVRALHVRQAEIEDDEVGLLGEQFERDLAVRRFEHLVALGAKPHAQQLADGRLVVDDQNLQGSGAHAAVTRFRSAAGTGRLIVNTAPLPIGTVRRDDRAVHGLDEAARDRQARARCQRAPGRPSAPDRTCRRCAPGPLAGIPSPSSRTCRRTVSCSRQLCNANDGVGGRVFGGIVEEIEQRLLEQHGVDLDHRQIRRDLDLHPMPRQDLVCAPQRAADDLADIVRRGIGDDGTGFELGHVEQIGDEAIEALRLVDDRRQQIGLLGSSASRVAQRPRRAQHRRERRLQVVRDRGEQRRAQAVRLEVRSTRSMSSTRRRARSPARPGRSAHRAAGVHRA